MSGLRSLGASAVGALAVTILALGTGLALAPGAARAAPAPEFTLEFPGLEPGVPQSDTGAFTLDRAADLVAFEWLEQVGLLAGDAVTIDLQACDSAGNCVDPRALTGPVPFAAGVGTVTITAELTGEVTPGQTGSVAGRLTFQAEDAGLAATGFAAAPWIAGGVAAIAVGALLIALMRRRRDPRDEWSG